MTYKITSVMVLEITTQQITMYYGEKFNSITHLTGAVLSLVGLGALVSVGLQADDLRMIIGFSAFGITLVLLYTMSTLYHSFRPPRLKKIFRKLDHTAIYLLIAGSYAPYALVTLKNSRGTLLLSIICLLAIAGILLDLLLPERIELLQVAIYLAMGWMALIDYNSLISSLPEHGMAWLWAGGLAYTGGVGFYLLDDKNPYFHGIWHIFVMAGSLCTFISIIGYVR